MAKFEIIMIGNTAVGKTSMLASLFNELDSYNLVGALQLEPTTDESRKLRDQTREMQRQIDAQKPFTTLSISRDRTAVDFVEHKVDLKINQKPKHLVLFTDTRGGMTGETDQRLVARINDAFGVFCVIDASVLMECEDAINDMFNCPREVKSILKPVYTDGDNKQPRFVAFILTKCEKYMSTDEGREELLEAFHKHYDNTVDMLKKVPHAPNCYVLAIQTMCQVSFFKRNDKTKLPEFRILEKGLVQTKDCAYPLVILLQNLIDSETSKVSIWGKILQALGLKEDLKEYRKEIKKNIKQPLLFKKL